MIYVAIRHSDEGPDSVLCATTNSEACTIAVLTDLFRSVRAEHYDPCARFRPSGNGGWRDQWSEGAGAPEYSVETWEDGGRRIDSASCAFDQYLKALITTEKLGREQVVRMLEGWREKAMRPDPPLEEFAPMFSRVRKVRTYTSMRDEWTAAYAPNLTENN